jgi:predicted permease
MTIAAVATLGVAIGATVAIFQVVDRALIHPVPVADLDGLLVVQQSTPGGGRTSFPWVRVERLKQVGGIGVPLAITSSASDRPSRQIDVRVGTSGHSVDGRFVTANFCRLIGVAPSLGRDLESNDELPGAGPVALVSDRFWRAALGGSSRALGSTIYVNGTATTVVGVLPRRFRGLVVGANGPDVFFPLASGPILAAGLATDGANRFTTARAPDFRPSPVSPVSDFQILLRLPKAKVALAQRELEAVAGSSDWSVAPLADTLIPLDARSDLRQFVTVLAVTVGLILLIGSANLAGLLLARTEERRAELALCAALGAGKARLALDTAADAVVLTLLGSAPALLIAHCVIRVLSAFALPGGVVIPDSLAIDVPTVFVAVGATAIAGILIGLAPVVRAANQRLTSDMAALVSSMRRFRVLRLLVATQVAISLVLVFLAVLFVHAMSTALSTDVGFNRQQLLDVTVAVPSAVAATGPSRVDRLLAQVRSVPGVATATIGSLPIVKGADATQRNIVVDGVMADSTMTLETVYAADDYFRTLQQPLLRGREFTTTDQSDSTLVAVVNRQAAAVLWGGGDPIGRRIGIRRNATNETVYQVVGVARDVKVGGLREADRPILYLSRAQHAAYLHGFMVGKGGSSLIVRSARGSADLARTFSGLAQANRLELRSVTSLTDRIDEILMPQRLGRLLLLLFASIATLLSLVGVYGLAACIASQSTREVGIRIALGATAAQIVNTLLRRILVPVIWGVALGCGGAVLAGRLVTAFLYGGDSASIGTLSSAIVGIIAISLVIAAIPLWKTRRVSPAAVLRL